MGFAQPMDSAVVNEQVNRILQSRALSTKAQLRKLLGLLSRNLDSQAALTPDSVIRGLWPDEVGTMPSEYWHAGHLYHLVVALIRLRPLARRVRQE